MRRAEHASKLAEIQAEILRKLSILRLERHRVIRSDVTPLDAVTVIASLDGRISALEEILPLVSKTVPLRIRKTSRR